MAGQSDAADDLIAELAKLMAQDAKGDRPAEAAAPAFSVRIPGGDTAPAAAPRFDFDQSESLAAPTGVALAAPAEPVAPPAAEPAPAEAAPEPFHFDFGLGSSRRTPAEAVAPAAEQPAPAEHDSIADLIAAELTSEPETVEPPAEPVAADPHPYVPPLATPVATPAATQDNPARAELHQFNLRNPSRPEQDRFKVPPVFGLGSRPAAPVEPIVSPAAATPEAPVQVEHFASLRQPSPAVSVPPAPAAEDDGLGRDPIDEIESLIGRAMRVEFDKPAAAAPEERAVPSPALQNLANVAVPAAAAEPHSAPTTFSGADEAILAAAQATGAEIGWVEAPEVDDVEAAAVAAAPRRARSFGLNRSVAGPLIAVALLVAAGLGLYWVLGMGQPSGPAPLLTADTTPIKETPAVQPDAAASQQSVVFNEMNGVVPGDEEQLVSRDQADLNEVTQVPPATEVSEEGLANRKVRTVTVRPDGTIVSGEESVAGSAILPVDRPNVPEVPGAETASPELLASVEPEAAVSAPAAEPAATTEPTVTPVEPGSTVQAVDAAGNVLAGRMAPVPVLRPAGLVQATEPMVTSAAAAPVNAVVSTPTGGNLLPPPPANSAFGTTPAATQPVAVTQPAATPQPAAAANIPGAVEVDAIPNSAPAYAQLASLRSEEEARQAAQNLVARFGPLFGGANMEVQRVDLGARGIYYRVRVPAASTSAAGNICTNVIAAGGDCVAM
jgi:hypothetical protein